MAVSLLKPPRNNSRRGRNVQTELKSTVYSLAAPRRETSNHEDIRLLICAVMDSTGGKEFSAHPAAVADLGFLKGGFCSAEEWKLSSARS